MSDEIMHVTARCPIRTTLELVGGKWKLLIMSQLASKPLRLSSLKKQIPDVSEKMLIQELKNLVDSGLVIRTQFEEVPLRIQYELSDIGKRIIPLMDEMRNFAIAYEKERDMH